VIIGGKGGGYRPRRDENQVPLLGQEMDVTNPEGALTELDVGCTGQSKLD